MYKCPRCNGEGIVPSFLHVEAGVCFQCEGTGQVPFNSEFHIKDESCTAIHRLQLIEGDQYYIAAFYVWEDDGRKHANTGHFAIDLIDPTQLDQDNYEDCFKSTPVVKLDGKFHQPLSWVRQQYRALLDMGYKPVEYHPSLYHPEPF